MSIDWLAVLNTTAAGGSTLAAIAAWKAANHANSIATEAKRTAELMADIERSRRHQELTPELEVSITRLPPPTPRATLRITLLGPPALQELHSIALTIRNDDLTHPASAHGSPTQEEIDTTIWGPYQFQPNIDGTPPDGRTTPAFPMELGQSVPRSLQRTAPPHWTAPGAWDQDYRNEPVRLWIDCHHHGHAPWRLHHDIHPHTPT
jgi:hypothetical protein